MKYLDKHTQPANERRWGAQSRALAVGVKVGCSLAPSPAMESKGGSLSSLSLSNHLQLRMMYCGLWCSLWTNSRSELLFHVILTHSPPPKKVALQSFSTLAWLNEVPVLQKAPCSCSHTERFCKLVKRSPKYYCWAARDFIIILTGKRFFLVFYGFMEGFSFHIQLGCHIALLTSSEVQPTWIKNSLWDEK